MSRSRARRFLGRITRAAALTAFVLATGRTAASSPAQTLPAADFFQDKVWTVQLELTARDWAALQPTQQFTRTGAPAPQDVPHSEAEELGYVFPYAHASIRIGSALLPDVGLRAKGSDTFLWAIEGGKWSWKVDFDHYVKGQRFAGLKTLNLHNSITDPGFMNEALGYRLYRSQGVAAPRTTYARVFVNVPGLFTARYFGLYVVVEQVDSTFVEDHFDSPAAIFKPFTREVFPDLGTSWARYRDRFNPQSTLTDADTRRVVDLCQLVARSSDAVFDAEITHTIDVEGFARLLAVAVWLADPDSILDGGKNFYLLLSRTTRQFTVVPWDLDHAFGQFPVIDSGLLQQLNVFAPARRGDNTLVTRLLKNQDFRSRYLGALTDLVTRDARPEALAIAIDALTPIVRSAVAEESRSALADFDRAVAGQTVTRAGNGGTPIRTFAIARTRSVAAQLARR
jgi:spore coat protein H